MLSWNSLSVAELTPHEDTAEVMGGHFQEQVTEDRDFCPASLFSLLNFCLLALVKSTALSCPTERTQQAAGHSQQRTETISPTGQEEQNPALSHLSEPGSRSTTR